MRYRLRTLLIVVAIAPVALAAFSANFLTLPLRDADATEAARELVAWIVEGRPVPGFGEHYPDAKWMEKRKRFFVICDFVPAGVSLSRDPRVHRITEEEYNAVFKKHGYDEAAYLTIELKSKSNRLLVVEFSNMFGTLGGHGYQFEFRRKLWGLRAAGKFLWVS